VLDIGADPQTIEVVLIREGCGLSFGRLDESARAERVDGAVGWGIPTTLPPRTPR